MLSNKPIEVVGGVSAAAFVEVKPQGVSKGQVVERVLKEQAAAAGGGGGGGGRFVLAIGDGRADEEMFSAVEAHAGAPGGAVPVQAYCCVVGQKPSRAPNYLNDAGERCVLCAFTRSLCVCFVDFV